MDKILSHYQAYLLTERCVARNTSQAYMNDMRQLEQFLHQEQRILQTATHDMLISFLAMLKKQKISATSMSRKISAIKNFFSWAHTTLQWPDHAQDLTFPKLEKKLPNFLTDTKYRNCCKLLMAILLILAFAIKLCCIFYMLRVCALQNWFH